MSEATVETQPTSPTLHSRTNDNDGPLNPALSEPDAMAIAQRSAATLAPSVSLARKKDLLVKARKERRKWIQLVPLPYTNLRDPDNIWSFDDRLHQVQTSLACKRITSATKVLSELYGLENNIRNPEAVAERVDALVQPFVTDDKILNDAPEVLAEALSKDDSEVVRSYHDFWTTLLKPECAMLVQGMRNFLRNLHDNTEMEKMSNSMKTYLDGAYESLKSHAAWKDRVDQGVRRSLESYVYGHAQGHLEKLEWKGLFPITQEEFGDRLEKLQFVSPAHLEIECLNNPELDVDALLQSSIDALLSIDQYFSPFEKLQRILAVYKGVNAALSEALNQDQSGSRKLPSADDVLPTIILTTLKAKPNKIFRNLQFVDVFATSENLRGEAGYAYTNLYGAVQFLADLDMDKPNFSISPEEFRKGIEEYMAKTKKQVSDATKEKKKLDDPVSCAEISVQEVREGRLNGEDVNLQWALIRQQEHSVEESMNDSTTEGDSMFSVNLPSRFNRTYSFLGTRPEDVRIADLPRLLEEYKMIAHVTEQLLGERAALQAAEKKRKAAERQNNVEDTLIGDLPAGSFGST